MRAKLLALVLLALALAAWLLWSSSRDASESAHETLQSAEHSGAEAELAPSPLDAPASRAVVDAPAADAPRALRGRVIVADSGAALAGCDAELRFVGSYVNGAACGEDGRFEFTPPIAPGTELEVSGPEGWAIEPTRIELDAVPADELLFRAHALSSGIVHGLVVDEVDDSPVPYLPLALAGESLLTDSAGAFLGARPHPRGRLEISFSNWTYTCAWDPASDEPLIVPARVGPAFFLELDPLAAQLQAGWTLQGLERATPAIAVTFDEQQMVSSNAPTLVRFSSHMRARPVTGELVVWSIPDFLYGRAALAPGRGTESDPLHITLARCGFLEAELESNRGLSYMERVTVTLLPRRDSESSGVEAHASALYRRALFVVTESGDFWLEAKLDGKLLGRVPASAHLREGVPVALPLDTFDPEEEGPASPNEPVLPVRALVTSAANRAYKGQLRLTRIADGDETLLDLTWTKESDRWLGHVAGEAPAGEYRAKLEIWPHFTSTGPETIQVPLSDELVYAIEDAVPVADVYLEPVAAESGQPLLAFDALLNLARGDVLGGDDFSSPSVPLAEGHPRSVPFFWVCAAPGRRPACGAYVPDGGTGDIHIPVKLERGWGVIVYVGDRDSLGLEGVRVLCDGVPSALTNGSGYACVGGERPRRMSFEYQGWQLDPESRGDVRADGSFEDSEGWVNAYLAPPGK